MAFITATVRTVVPDRREEVTITVGSFTFRVTASRSAGEEPIVFLHGEKAGDVLKLSNEGESLYDDTLRVEGGA